MTPIESFRERQVALFGLDAPGLATLRALMAGGASVTAWDDAESARLQAIAEGMNVADLSVADWGRFDALILTPGAAPTHPVPHWTVERAQAAGVEIIGDLELFCREREARAPGAVFVVVTGANGQSTTSALIAHILREAGREPQLGGDVGQPILSLAPPDDERIHVVEVSSFQIDLAPSLSPTVGLLLNLSPDHLDRQGSMERDAAVKERVPSNAEIALVGVDDAYCHAIGAKLIAEAAEGRRVAPVSGERSLDWGFYAEGDEILYRAAGDPEVQVESLGALPKARALVGAYNRQNAIFAAAACWELGLSDEEIAQGLVSFTGVPHRLETVAKVGRVLFVNDSKATDAAAAARALAEFSEIFWILGGKPKHGGIESLRPFFPRVAKAYLIGEATEEFAETLEGYVPFERCCALTVATDRAASDAVASAARDPVVLLAPACASYDQFADFEARGEAFREIVQRIAALDQGDAS
ncbi:UDP-N-acetylmuramoyl-L-alanine--D-glutamate ligase [Methylocystis bryophila]|uniref:UDP-N-acetylmuramoylalanine--D-glutamate ligase n=1 Tax=Methylocystis bryophila TaxID=655015 RepID=A0A1W6MVV9_9HYPH|nr:UDP-N-acetylmuramoyl-L-alanine--D-glutamate ligase [Methylocystis bryophila]ARN81629.1 UDP-N-acetylmuramoyl-L-alanine--D-glutamate ligase [Methylocystis bryophila]BDV37669.1 UDP-N-acetylmuramoylalanine--D-glutamate ligase [Methylocystis bryophila]